MGQRMQCFIKTPGQIFVFHNQWLYGVEFIKWTARLVKALKYHGEKRIFDIQRFMSITIGHANYGDISYPTDTHIYYNDKGGCDYNHELIASKDSMDFIKKWDNDNGFVYVELIKRPFRRFDVVFDIMNGFENADKLESRTPKEYVNLFYNDKELTSCKSIFEAIEYLDTIDKVSMVDRIEEFRKDLLKEGDEK